MASAPVSHDGWQQALGPAHLRHPSGFTICRVPCGGSLRFELYGRGQYHGWHATASKAKAAHQEILQERPTR